MGDDTGDDPWHRPDALCQAPPHHVSGSTPGGGGRNADWGAGVSDISARSANRGQSMTRSRPLVNDSSPAARISFKVRQT